MAHEAAATRMVIDEMRKLPEGWHWVPLCTLCQSIIGGGTPDRNNPNYWGGDIPWASVKDLNTEILVRTQESITLQGLENSSAKLVNPGTVIVATRMGLGKVALAQTRIAINQDLKGLLLTPTCLPEYIVLFLKSRSRELERQGAGATVKGIKLEELKGWTIPIPYPDDPQRSLDVQSRIVARIEALMTELKRARVLLGQMLSVMNHIMEAALAQVFGHIRNGFEVTGIPTDQIRSIGDVAKFERGKFTHRPRNDPQFFGGSIPWIQIQNLPRDYHKYITEYMNTLNDRGLAISKLFPKGTLVLSIAATIGALGILDFDACFPDSLVGITPNSSEIDLGFLYWQLLFIRSHLDTIAPAAAQKKINLQILSQINLWKPSDQEQKRIDIYLDELQSNLDKMKELLDQDAKLLDRTEQSILERAFRGEL
jgi:type I restriction enzyme, S subunit